MGDMIPACIDVSCIEDSYGNANTLAPALASLVPWPFPWDPSVFVNLVVANDE
jgi:hypothetical protein